MAGMIFRIGPLVVQALPDHACLLFFGVYNIEQQPSQAGADDFALQNDVLLLPPTGHRP